MYIMYKGVGLFLLLLLPLINIQAQKINWATETGLAAGSTFTNGQVISNFAGTGIAVTINVTLDGINPRIDPTDPTKVNMVDCDPCSFTITANDGISTFNVQLLNNQNLIRGERITVSNTSNRPITIQETSSNGGLRMLVGSVAMTGSLPSIIVGSSTVSVFEPSNGTGTDWNATMTDVTSFTWTYNRRPFDFFGNEGFCLNLLGSALPVRLVDFDVFPQDGNVLLTWSTISEFNNDFFSIERSKNALEWEHVLNIDGTGNTTSEQVYEALDTSPYTGLSYYRLKQTDFDGTFSYSKILSVRNDIDDSSLVFPNPSSQQVTVKGIKAGFIGVYDSKGVDVTRLININNIRNGDYSLDLSKLNPGLYLIQTESKRTRFHKH